MSQTDLLAEFCKLSPQERYEIRVKLAELDGEGWDDADDPLSPDQRALIDARIEAHDRDPGAAIPWEEMKSRLDQRCGE
ncbi:MAG: addiction module protein [Phycisphaerales bacterium]|nr:addiction module protein [Phycisphaerales bacterium]